MTDAELRKSVEDFEAKFLPPDGTPLSDVEAVYGDSSPSRAIETERLVPLWRARDGRGSVLVLNVQNGLVSDTSIAHGQMMGHSKLNLREYDESALDNLVTVDRLWGRAARLAPWNH